MRKKLRYFIFLIFLISHASDVMWAENAPRPPKNAPKSENVNFNGRKMPRKNTPFFAIGVKVQDGAPDTISISVYFSDALDAHSVVSHHISIDGKQIPDTTEFLFNKTRHMVRFEIKKADFSLDTQKTFSLTLTGARSFDGRTTKSIELSALEKDTFSKYDKETDEWQKSSL